jgi:hypothetical protein
VATSNEITEENWSKYGKTQQGEESIPIHTTHSNSYDSAHNYGAD